MPQAVTGTLDMSGPGGGAATAVAFRVGVFGHLQMDGPAPSAPDEAAILGRLVESRISDPEFLAVSQPATLGLAS